MSKRDQQGGVYNDAPRRPIKAENREIDIQNQDRWERRNRR
jgi:hypothetical protein